MIHCMSKLESLFPVGRAAWIREQLLGAITHAYDENCTRYAEELGDNATTFGICLFHNICFLLEQRLEGAADIAITRPDNSFVVRIDDYHLHVYKAPPGADSIHGVRFDQSAIRLGLVEANSGQLRLKFDATNEQQVFRAPHLVVVHFGDPIDGVRYVEIGAPISSDADGLGWAWVESLMNPEKSDRLATMSLDAATTPAEMVPDFGLQIIDRADANQAGERQRSS